MRPSCQKRLAAAVLAAGALAPAFAQDAGNAMTRFNARDPAALSGRWNGANLEQRANCSDPLRNGFHGTYAEYLVTIGSPVAGLIIEETTVTGLRCTWSGERDAASPGLAWSGRVSCSDGKNGTFRTRSVLITPNEMSLRLTLKLETTETCDVDAVLGGSRL